MSTATNNVTARISISLDAAQRVVEKALSAGRDAGVELVVAVVDSSGNLVALAKTDQAPVMSVDFARRKAYTAVAVGGLPTTALAQFVASVPDLHNTLPHQPDIAVIGGGVPLRDGDTLIGAVGISGGTVDQDVELAEAAATALT